MSRQHATPLLIPTTGQVQKLTPRTLAGGPDAVTEDEIQQLVHEHPSLLPIAEIDPIYLGPVAICRELNTPAGPIDNFLVTPGGLPVVVECKLWRNGEARREVVGQILDYARELSRFSASDLDRETRRRLGPAGPSMFELVRTAAPDLNETAFQDALTLNLRRGRFLLLIVGDGVRERVESIAEYLQTHAGLHFSFGLVELPIFDLPNGDRLVAPRVLAHSTVFSRDVVALPEGFAFGAGENPAPLGETAEPDSEVVALGDDRQAFWTEFLAVLADRKLDDPEQPIPRAPRTGSMAFGLPAPASSCWLTVYRNINRNEVGLFLSSTRDSVGEAARRRVAEDWDEIGPLLGEGAQLIWKDDLPYIQDTYRPGPLADPEARANAFAWLADRTNTFINVLRPRIRSAVADITGVETN